MLIRLIKTDEELREYQREVRNRQYEDNPVRLEFINEPLNGWGPYDWNKEYIRITRIGDYETLVYVRRTDLLLRYLRYPHIFNVMGIPEDKMYI